MNEEVKALKKALAIKIKHLNFVRDELEELSNLSGYELQNELVEFQINIDGGKYVETTRAILPKVTGNKTSPVNYSHDHTEQLEMASQGNPALTNMVGSSHYKPLVVILNGPPGCGKDTIANAWVNAHSYHHNYSTKSFKEPMYKVAAAALGMPLENFLARYEDREWKEKSRPEWGGKSVRDLMISTSEDFLKPMFGNNHMGNLAVKSIKQEGLGQGDIVVFTDGGFDAEVRELEKNFHVQVVHVLRDGCSFDGDSRSYIEGEQRKTYLLFNDSTIESAVSDLDWIIAQAQDDIYGRS